MEGYAGHFKFFSAGWFEGHHRIIHGYLYALTKDRHLADDLTQETFMKAWEYRERYEERGVSKAFLFQIASRSLKDHYRRKHEVLCGEEAWSAWEREAGEPGPEESAETAEEIARMHRVMARLSRAQQEVLSLRYFSQLTFSEIARILEMPLNTVLSHARRGLAALKENFEDGTDLSRREV